MRINSQARTFRTLGLLYPVAVREAHVQKYQVEGDLARCMKF